MTKKLLLLTFFISIATAGITQNYALDFDGVEDYVDVDYSSALNPASFTVEAWFKTGSLNVTQAIVASRSATSDGYTIYIVSGATTGTIQVQTGNGSTWDLDDTGIEVSANTWVHVATSYDGTTKKIYINGSEEYSDTRTVSQNTDKPLFIGAGAPDEASPDFYFDGAIDEVRIWSDVRTQDEIRGWMCGELTGSEDNLVAYYKLNETTGIIADNAEGTDTYDGDLNGTDFTFANNSVDGSTSMISGSGTSGSPYQVSTINHLNYLKTNSSIWDKSFSQTANIDASGTSSWNSGHGLLGIGTDPIKFTGVYDGGGYTISNLSNDTKYTGNYFGLFGFVSTYAIVKNLGLINADILASNFASCLCGKIQVGSQIINCYVDNTSSLNAGTIAGGICGLAYSSTLINTCYSEATITCSSTGGGLIGELHTNSIAVNSYSKGDVTVSGSNCGGLIGRIYGSSIINCYSTGTVTCSGSYVGGFSGYTFDGNASYYNCFWDNAQAGVSVVGDGGSTGITSASTATMQTLSTFTSAGWDFTSPIWAIASNEYPNLGSNTTPNCWVGSTTAWGTASNWSLKSVPTSSENVSISISEEQPSVSSSGTLCNNLVINTGVELTIDETRDLTVGGNLTNNGTLTISSSASGSGSLIVEGTSTGNITVQRYLTQGKWHYISSPVNDTRVFNEFLSLTGGANNDQFYWWDEDGSYNSSTGIWFDILNNPTGISYTVNSFVGSQGYAISYAGSGSETISFVGEPYTVDQNINITKTLTSTRPGSNLVGNPFTSTIALNLAASANSFLNTNKDLLKDENSAVYLWNEQVNYTGNRDDYATISNSESESYLAPGQAFMVIKDAEGSSPLLFNTNMRKHGSATFYKNKANDDVVRFYMSVENAEGLYNEILVAFIEDMTKGLDVSYDAGKLKGNPDIALYTRLVDDNGYDFAHQALPPLTDKAIAVKTGIDVSASGEYTFKIKELQNFDEFTEIKLQDKQSSTIVDLRIDGEYSFYISSPGEIRDRFVLHFNGVTGIEDEELVEKEVSVYASYNILTIFNNNHHNGSVTITNLMGQVINSFNLDGSNTQTYSLSAPGGIYIVSIENDNGGVYSEKVFIY